MGWYPQYCRWCGNSRKDHGVQYRNHAFEPQPKPNCRVCGKPFNPANSGRDDCCYRHRMDS